MHSSDPKLILSILGLGYPLTHSKILDFNTAYYVTGKAELYRVSTVQQHIWRCAFEVNWAHSEDWIMQIIDKDSLGVNVRCNGATMAK